LGSLTVLSRETVGPQVGKDLRRKATQATVWALLGMLVYIAVRFKLAYGVSAILTLTHDVLVTLSVFSFTHRELNLPVIAAVLTIVGYSINDTIVIFDRVRDNLKLMRKSPFEDILNASINQTLSRTVITSGTVFLTVIALYLFGGEVINDFAFTMLIGVISGTYSTIYQSCPIVLFWREIFGLGKRVRR
ncbi:MAG TPA: protein translocase subunit SecF, partial [Candidatus Desulfaltia sp.]|nr:protein translocase subunit SecF [Candidatus Desulfaltia sp.]